MYWHRMLQSIRKYPVLNLDTPEKTKVIPDAYFWPFHVIQSFSTEISINIEYWKWSGNVLFDSSCSRQIDSINKSWSILIYRLITWECQHTGEVESESKTSGYFWQCRYRSLWHLLQVNRNKFPISWNNKNYLQHLFKFLLQYINHFQ